MDSLAVGFLSALGGGASEYKNILQKQNEWDMEQLKQQAELNRQKNLAKYQSSLKMQENEQINSLTMTREKANNEAELAKWQAQQNYNKTQKSSGFALGDRELTIQEYEQLKKENKLDGVKPLSERSLEVEVAKTRKTNELNKEAARELKREKIAEVSDSLQSLGLERNEANSLARLSENLGLKNPLDLLKSEEVKAAPAELQSQWAKNAEKRAADAVAAASLDMSKPESQKYYDQVYKTSIAAMASTYIQANPKDTKFRFGKKKKDDEEVKPKVTALSTDYSKDPTTNEGSLKVNEAAEKLLSYLQPGSQYPRETAVVKVLSQYPKELHKAILQKMDEINAKKQKKSASEVIENQFYQ